MKRLGRINLVAVAAVLFVSAVVLPTPANAVRKTYREGRILVKFKDGTNDVLANKTLSESGSKRKGKLSGIQTIDAEVIPGNEAKTLAKLSSNPNVEYAELDTWYSAVSTDPLFGYQYGLHNTGQTIGGQVGVNDADIDAPEAWLRSSGNGVKVAVLDSGVDQNHQDLMSKIVSQQNFTTSPNVDDLYGHGTHVAGIIAATTNNSLGVAGVCPGCQLLNGKVLGDNGSGATSWIANGITWAANNGAKVINLSLGSTTPSKTMEDAVKYAWSKGAVVVAAAGNNGSKTKFYPAAYTNAIAVAATDNRDVKASFSNYGGSWVDVAAPGAYIVSTLPNHTYALGTVLNYGYLSGTSMAAPMVAGTAGLVWSTSYGTSSSSVRNRIESKADKVAGTSYWTYWTHGRVNAARAVTP